MNLRSLNTSDTSDNVEELRRQIESALGSVEEIVKNKAVISVATEPEQPAGVQSSDQDEVVVYVSIKINKNQNQDLEREREREGQHQNGTSGYNGVNGRSTASSGEVEAERAGRRKVVREECEVTGQAITPGRRGRGGGRGRLARSLTAPSTPMRTRAAASLRTNSGQQTKSLEVRQQTSVSALQHLAISTTSLQRNNTVYKLPVVRASVI